MPMDLGRLTTLIDVGEIDTVIVGFADPHGRLMGKRVDAVFFRDHVVEHGGHACDYLFTTNLELDVIEGFDFASWQRGYGDVHVRPDLASLRRASWADGTAIVLSDVFDQRTGDPVGVSPRSILARQVERLADLGLRAETASELEFYLCDDTYRTVHERGTARPSGWYAEDYDLLHGSRHEPYLRAVRRALSEARVAVENSKGETGIGQHELNIHHTDVAEMADRHLIMKHAMKAIADQQGRSITFMAKPFGDQAGSSCHLHLSLWHLDTNGDVASNAFVDPDGRPTDTFRWFLGGWMQHLNDVMVWYAPTINSYKRYIDSSWAPTRVAWADDNRTVGFRIVGDGLSRRIECRIPGADCNPYLAYAASLASGIAGIEQRIEPPPPFDGNAYEGTQLDAVSSTLADAVDRFAASQFAADALGPDVVAHYHRIYAAEVAAANRAVTDWERRRYFERI